MHTPRENEESQKPQYPAWYIPREQRVYLKLYEEKDDMIKRYLLRMAPLEDFKIDERWQPWMC